MSIALLMNLKTRLAKNVKKYLVKTPTTLEKFAYENGISKGYMSDIVNGKANASLNTLEKLARGLGIEPLDLLR